MADPTPEELAADAAASSSWTLLFCQRDHTGDRWRRDAQQYEDLGPDAQLPLAAFWAAADPEKVLLACLLNGLVATRDEEFAFADEPDLNTATWQDGLKWYERSDTPRSWYTVFAVWDDDGTGHKRYSQFVEAVDATHAELQVRAAADRGEFLVAGVVDLRVPVADLPDWDIYATPDGQRPRPPAPAPHTSWLPWRRRPQP